MSASQKEFANLADILLFVCAFDDFLTTDWYFYAIEILNKNKGSFQKLLSGFFSIKGVPPPPTPLKENHFAKKRTVIVLKKA